MEYSSCPTALVNAPVQLVWQLLTDPAEWGRFYDLRVTKVEPPGLAAEGQKFHGESGPRFLHLRLTFEYVKIDPVRYLLNFNVKMPFGLFVREEMDCVPLNNGQCRVNYHCNFSFPEGGRGSLLRVLLGRKLDSGPADSISRLKRAAEQLYGCKQEAGATAMTRLHERHN
jgi:uncharacterized protein YndB with AHSA1/START domain